MRQSQEMFKIMEVKQRWKCFFICRLENEMLFILKFSNINIL